MKSSTLRRGRKKERERERKERKKRTEGGGRNNPWQIFSVNKFHFASKMFANYLSRKNFSHTRANRRRNASPVGLPAALVSITSQEAASHGLCGLPPGRPAFSMKEVCGYLGVCSSQLGETVPGEPSRSSCVPGSPLLSSLPFSSLLLCLLPSSPPISSLPFPSYSSFSLSLNQSVENCCLYVLMFYFSSNLDLASSLTAWLKFYLVMLLIVLLLANPISTLLTSSSFSSCITSHSLGVSSYKDTNPIR